MMIMMTGISCEPTQYSRRVSDACAAEHHGDKPRTVNRAGACTWLLVCELYQNQGTEKLH